MAGSIYSEMMMINPYRLWSVTVYDNIAGYNEHAMSCYFCYLYLHYNNRYNIIVDSLDPESVGNSTVLQDPMIVNLSNNGEDAIDVTNTIWNDLCVTGVITAARYIDLWTYANFDTRQTFQVGSKHTVIVWAVDNFCGHDDPPTARKVYPSNTDVFLQ